MFAVVSLWFNNQTDPAVNQEMEEITRTVCVDDGDNGRDVGVVGGGTLKAKYTYIHT